MTNMIVIAIISFLSLIEAVPYSKYGRSCKDIGCRSDEICFMAVDPCTLPNIACGPYPSCRKPISGEKICKTFFCPSGQYCKTDNNGSPFCENTLPGLGEYDSSGNGQRTNTATNNHGSHTSNSNPYQNADAPPAEDVFGSPVKPYQPMNPNAGSNLGYPPYPSNSGSGNSHSSGNNNGYPPFPTNQGNSHQPGKINWPLPNQPGYPYGQSGYPQPAQFPLHPPPGYSQQPPSGQRYPQQNSGYPNYASPKYNSGYRGNSASSINAASTMIIMISTIYFVLSQFTKQNLFCEFH